MSSFQSFSRGLLGTAAFVAAIAVSSVASYGQSEGPRHTRVLVRAEGKDSVPTSLRASDLRVEVAGQQREVTRVAPLISQAGLSGNRGQQVEVALLLDDGLRSNFAVNLKDVDRFVQSSVSATTAVGVGYMRNGAAYFPSGFSHDPEVVKKAVRLPISSGGVSGSPYFCLQELVKHWPTQTNSARVVLMITNGIDLYNGSVSPLNQDSPYVDEAIRDAQRAAIPVYSIYFGGRDINSGPGSFSGQSYLGKVADDTGGLMFNQGTITPPSLAPYFSRFQQALANTYTVEFLEGSRRLDRLKVSTSLSGVKVHAQHDIQAAPGAARSE